MSGLSDFLNNVYGGDDDPSSDVSGADHEQPAGPPLDEVRESMENLLDEADTAISRAGIFDDGPTAPKVDDWFASIDTNLAGSQPADPSVPPVAAPELTSWFDELSDDTSAGDGPEPADSVHVVETDEVNDEIAGQELLAAFDDHEMADVADVADVVETGGVDETPAPTPAVAEKDPAQVEMENWLADVDAEPAADRPIDPASFSLSRPAAPQPVDAEQPIAAPAPSMDSPSETSGEQATTPGPTPPPSLLSDHDLDLDRALEAQREAAEARANEPAASVSAAFHSAVGEPIWSASFDDIIPGKKTQAAEIRVVAADQSVTEAIPVNTERRRTRRGRRAIDDTRNEVKKTSGGRRRRGSRRTNDLPVDDTTVPEATLHPAAEELLQEFGLKDPLATDVQTSTDEPAAENNETEAEPTIESPVESPAESTAELNEIEPEPAVEPPVEVSETEAEPRRKERRRGLLGRRSDDDPRNPAPTNPIPTDDAKPAKERRRKKRRATDVEAELLEEQVDAPIVEPPASDEAVDLEPELALMAPPPFDESAPDDPIHLFSAENDEIPKRRFSLRRSKAT